MSVTLGADTKKQRTIDSTKILEYAYKNFYQISLKEKIEAKFKTWQEENKIEVIKGKINSIQPTMADILYEKYPISKSEENKLEILTKCEDSIEAPIEEGREVGYIDIILKGKSIMKLKLMINQLIEKKGVKDYLKEFCKKIKELNMLEYKHKSILKE
ncbi:MAG: hypothetical protein IKP28_02445 [Clostridia bacterium]|nr:hypothetical protein [Clostridia bacterium]